MKKHFLIKKQNSILFLLLAFRFSLNAQVVTTLAGSGVLGFMDATGTAARFSFPWGVATDASGNVYVSDHGNHKIRKITPAGVVSTIAGSGSVGSADGIGTAASFNNPDAVATDATGNIYVAENLSHIIRKITPSGVVTTFAGSGSIGSADATGTAASFNFPIGVATDASGNVYVADRDNNKIRKITAGGVVTTLAGSGSMGSTDATGTAASFNFPQGVTTDKLGNVYVADFGNDKIRKISPGGVVTTLAGSGAQGSTDGSGSSASFHGPVGVACDASGNVYVADNVNHKIRKITPMGVVTTLAGTGSAGSTDTIGTSASFRFPMNVATDVSGNVYVADWSNHKIRKIAKCSISSSFSDTICSNQSYTWNGIARTTSGAYLDTFIASNLCDSIVTLNLTVHPVPMVSIMYTGGKLVANAGLTSYKWLLGTTVLSSITNTYTPTVNGLYSVEVTDRNSCQKVSTYNLTTLALASPEGISKIEIYPNPTTKYIYIKSYERLEINFFGIDGKELKDLVIERPSNEEYRIDFSQYSKGIYLLKINNEMYKLVK